LSYVGTRAASNKSRTLRAGE